MLRRVAGEPTAYIRGVKEFFSLEFRVTPAVLIPRPETEELVEAALELLPGDGTGFAAADVGTGSGCIAVTLAVLRPGLALAASDLSAAALDLARLNAGRHGAEERIVFREGDMLEALAGAGPPGGFDLLISNPPYIDPQGAVPVDPGVARFEPAMALFTPPGDPCRFYRSLLASAAPLLAGDGKILFEVGADLAGRVERTGRGLGFEVMLRRDDLAGRPRVIGFRRGGA